MLLCFPDLRAQAEQQYKLSLPYKPRVIGVMPIVGVPDLFTLYYSDGSISDPTPLHIPAAARLLMSTEELSEASEAEANAKKAKNRKPRNKSVQDEDRRKRKKREQAKNTVRAPALPKALRPFGKATDAAALQESVDGDWNREQQDCKDEVAAFPRIPDDDRICRSAGKYRNMTSVPHIDYGVCSVCSQRVGKSQLQTFALNQTADDHTPLIGPQLLKFIRKRLEHDPFMPRHQTKRLPEGNVLMRCFSF